MTYPSHKELMRILKLLLLKKTLLPILSLTFQIRIDEKELKNPIMYWIPILHKKTLQDQIHSRTDVLMGQ
jgi:hypothetical protein